MLERISHYRVQRRLGGGAMGEVYLAEDSRLGRLVALKIIREDLASDEDRKHRFIQEARAASALNHPNILTIHDIGSESGRDFIAMEHVDGVTLRDRIRSSAPLPVAEIVDLGAQLASGLARAHEAGIVHRDLKPENIMIRPDGIAKILDFGLSKLRPAQVLETDETVVSNATQPGAILGTPRYMSPEQARGRDVDPRSDIFSLGCVLYEMATGKLPFEAESTIEILHAIIHDHPPPPSRLNPRVPPGLETVILRCLSKDPSGRYQRADEVAADLSAIPAAGEAPARPRRPGILRIAGVGVYLALAWGLHRMVHWLVDRYLLSPHWPTVALVAAALLLPGVLIWALVPASRRWRLRAPDVLLPVNILLAAGAVFLIFRGTDLGRATTAVTVTNEEGETIERVVPKTEFRKRVAIFFLESASTDSTTDWLAYGIPYALHYDLAQDIFVLADIQWIDAAREAGFSTALGLPLSLGRQIAGERHLAHFVTGSVSRSGAAITVDLLLHETRTGRELARLTESDASVFALVDRLSVRLRRELGIPESHIESTPDLAVAEIFTGSAAAFEAYARGAYAAQVQRDWERSIGELERAVTADSTFAGAYLELSQQYILNNRVEDRARAVDAAMRFVYKLPGTTQFVAKTAYYDVRQDPDRQMAVVRMWTELYPTDVTGFQLLGLLYSIRNQTDDAIATLRHALELDPGQTDLLLTIGRLQASSGDFQAALETFRSYTRELPGDPQGFGEIAGLEVELGNHAEARANLQKALAIKPGDTGLQLDLADVDLRLGNLDAALSQLERTLDEATTDENRASVHLRMQRLHELRGQLTAALEERDARLVESAKAVNPVFVLIFRIQTLDLLIEAGQTERALQETRELEETLGSPFAQFLLPMARANIHLARGEGDEAWESTRELAATIDAMRIHVVDGELAELSARALEMRGEREAAIAEYQRALQLNPTRSVDTRWRMARCYREAGRLVDARRALEEALKVFPAHPRANYEMALALRGLEERKAAWGHLRAALAVWEDADPGYAPAAEARATAASWSADGL